MSRHAVCFALLAGTLASIHPADSAARDFLPSITSRATATPVLRPAEVPADEVLEAERAVVGEISFQINDIFATQNAEDDATLFRLANALHINTKRATVEQKLLFNVGEPYSARKLAESERLLRNQRYLVDVHIVPIAYQDGRVHIKVFTRDVWTLKPGVSFGRSGGTNSSSVSFEESNLLGLGKQLSLDYRSDVDRTSTVLDYRDPNVWGSRWTLAAQWGDNSDGRKNGLLIERPFYALDSRWSAGLKLTDERRIDAVYDLGNVIDRYRLTQRGATLYYGVSSGLNERWAQRWTFGVTHDEYQFEPVAQGTGLVPVPDSRTLVYPWIGLALIEDNFGKTENLNQIGRTEDLNLGWTVSAQLGLSNKQIGADRNALIWSSSAVRNFAWNEHKITEIKAAFSGRLESSQVRNGLLTLSARHFVRQSPRQLSFFSAQADIGKRIDADQRLTLGGDTGLRGYPLRYQGGSGRWLLTAEQRVFTDWYPFRLMRVGGAAFLDIGRTFGTDPLGTGSIGTLRDVGFGLRIGHSRSGIGNVTHINVAFPLSARNDIKRVQLVIETKSSF